MRDTHCFGYTYLVPESHRHIQIVALAHAHYARLCSEALNADLFTSPALARYKTVVDEPCIYYSSDFSVPSTLPVEQSPELQNIKVRNNIYWINWRCSRASCEKLYKRSLRLSFISEVALGLIPFRKRIEIMTSTITIDPTVPLEQVVRDDRSLLEIFYLYNGCECSRHAPIH